MNLLAATVKPLLQGLQWHQASEFVLLALLAITLPIDWHIALWCLVLLCANTLVRIVVTRHVGNAALSRPIRTCLWLMILFYLTHAVSVLYSSQPSEALDTATTMLPLLLFPLLFLLTDTRHLSRRHLDLLTYLLAATLTARFLIMLIRAALHYADSQIFTGATDIFATLLAQTASRFAQIIPIPPFNDLLATLPIRAAAHLFNNTPFEHLPPYQFDPLHHNYLSLYILTAAALLYVQLVRHWQSPRWHRARWFVVTDIVLLSAYVLLSGSRSGIVAWVLLATACLAHLALYRKQRRTFAIILAATAIIIGLSYWASPKTFERITDTVHDMRNGSDGDIRQDMWQSGIATVKDRPLFGYGCDGYWDALFEQYRTHDCLDASVRQFSTHNQYLETLLATGIVGFTALLAVILAPILLSMRRPRRNLPMLLFTVVYATCILFEATFGRQMGLLFIGFWYCLLLHYSTTFTLQPKSP